MDQVKLIAGRIKELREVLEISAAEVAEKVNITEEQYASYESGAEDIPIGVLYGIAAHMGVDPTVFLTGKTPKMDEYTVVRGGKGVRVERYKGYDFTALAFNYKHRDMEPMIVHVSKDSDRPELVVHGGQEFNYVLKGTVRVVVGARSFELSAGDSIYFNPAIPHGQHAVTDEAEFLTIINE